jgi:hypothetical protein
MSGGGFSQGGFLSEVVESGENRESGVSSNLKEFVKAIEVRYFGINEKTILSAG